MLQFTDFISGSHLGFDYLKGELQTLLKTAFLRGSLILFDAENSASAIDIEFVSARPPRLAGRDKRCHKLSQGDDCPVNVGINFVLIIDSRGSSRFPIPLMVRER